MKDPEYTHRGVFPRSHDKGNGSSRVRCCQGRLRVARPRTFEGARGYAHGVGQAAKHKRAHPNRNAIVEPAGTHTASYPPVFYRYKVGVVDGDAVRALRKRGACLGTRHDGGQRLVQHRATPRALVPALFHARLASHFVSATLLHARWALEALQGTPHGLGLTANGAVRCHHHKNIRCWKKRVMELMVDFLLAVVIFGALVAFINRMCEEELPDV